jgi:DNA-directed RNA polymerase omega subunit
MINKIESTSIDYPRCSELIGNRFDMILVASQRAREIKRGNAKLVNGTASPIIVALKEIEMGKVGKDYLKRIK